MSSVYKNEQTASYSIGAFQSSTSAAYEDSIISQPKSVCPARSDTVGIIS